MVWVWAITVCWTALVGVHKHVQEPLGVMIDSHVALGFHVAIALVAHLVSIVLNSNCNAALNQSTLRQHTHGTMPRQCSHRKNWLKSNIGLLANIGS